MLVLEPICHETIWGGTRIARLAGVSGDKIGHLYSVFCREGVSNRILNGKWKGKHLNEVFPLWRAEFYMEKYPFFPLTLALTEADENLSIQVHPDDAAANALEHMARGKRESWYFLEAPKSGYIFNGCTCRSEAERDELVVKGRFLEMTDRLAVASGDYVFVEPGTLHSITAGSLVYEIEEGADFTYRFYDFDRVDSDGKPRELHTKKASTSLRIQNKSEVKHYCGSEWLTEKTYSTRKLDRCTVYQNESETVECFTFIQGRVECDGVPLKPGMTVLLWPGESIADGEIGLAFVSKLREGV